MFGKKCGQRHSVIITSSTCCYARTDTVTSLRSARDICSLKASSVFVPGSCIFKIYIWKKNCKGIRNTMAAVGNINVTVVTDSEEGRERLQRFERNYRKQSTIQVSVASMALVSGAISAGLAFLNPNFPYLVCFPLISGLQSLVAGVFGAKAARAKVNAQSLSTVKKYVVVHYVLCVVGITLCLMTVAFSGLGLGLCVSPPDNSTTTTTTTNSRGRNSYNFPHDVCTPHTTVRIPFLALDMLLALALALACIGGCVLFCLHARALGFPVRGRGRGQGHDQAVIDEVGRLRAEVAALRQAQLQQQQQQQGSQGYNWGTSSSSVPAHPSPPPSYWESSVPVGSGKGGGGGGGGGGGWPAGY
ncbi:uncharacterized protein LOC143275504 [Babylonia areolata]|uniref:uncharacterized protein LOC143275504 n=1 Tax=Babylonia areolata TaxID=304850 RepID=UPI003FD37C1C